MAALPPAPPLCALVLLILPIEHLSVQSVSSLPLISKTPWVVDVLLGTFQNLLNLSCLVLSPSSV